MGEEREEKFFVYTEVDMGNAYGAGFREGYHQGFIDGNAQHKKLDEKKEVV